MNTYTRIHTPEHTQTWDARTHLPTDAYKLTKEIDTCLYAQGMHW